MASARMYSWVDVEARLAALRFGDDWPEGLGQVSAYYDGVQLFIRDQATQARVAAWLERHFHERYQPEPEPCLLLEAAMGQTRPLPLQFEILEDEEPSASPLPMTPSWRRLAPLPEDPQAPSRLQLNHPPPFPPDTPPLVAFYSFKGGVGRTVHLVALLRELSERNVRALVIDADLEAPGISVLVDKDGLGVPEIALVDLLALAHGEPDAGWPLTLGLCAERLRSQPLRVGASEHFFLATYRDAQQSLWLDVRPEHLSQTRESAWHLGELFAALGRELKVNVVLIDLRAGLSELASPLLFDSRLHRVLVTTAAVQAREGTRLVLKQLGKLLPPADRDDLFDPEVILSMLNKERLESETRLGELLDDLEESYSTDRADDPAAPRRLNIDKLHRTEFYDTLPNAETLSDLIDRIRGCGLAAEMRALVEREWMSWLPAIGSATMPVATGIPPAQSQTNREKLFDAGQRLEYAENMGPDNRFLATAPLRALAQRFELGPPQAVVLGQKGAGKTFLFLRIVSSGQWAAFVEQALKRPVAARRPALVWPFIWSRQLGDDAQVRVTACMEAVRGAVHDPQHLPQAWSLSRLRDRVDEALKRGSTSETDWRAFWFSLLAESLGIAVAPGIDPVRVLLQGLHDKNVHLAVIADGVEELFADVRTDAVQQVAVRSLLQGVIERLREIPDPSLGLLICVRHDVAAVSIPQNFGQFERNYEPYLLRWSVVEALRLALWVVCEEARVEGFPALAQPLEQMDETELRKALYRLWGYKLGPATSREARSAEYVLSALADFQGRVQARDLVRLIGRAARLCLNDKAEEPLLQPKAIRAALDYCGEHKLRELLEEIALLKPPIDRLQQSRSAEARRSPFDPKQFALSAEDLQLLESVGLVRKEGPLYWLSELLRRGLGFAMRKGRRPRIVNL